MLLSYERVNLIPNDCYKNIFLYPTRFFHNRRSSLNYSMNHHVNAFSMLENIIEFFFLHEETKQVYKNFLLISFQTI